MRGQNRRQSTLRQVVIHLFLLGLIIGACRPNQQETAEQRGGTVLLWHDLSDETSAVLDQVVASFMDVHPDVRVNVASMPSTDLRQRFEEAVDSGLGPDLLLAPSSWIRPLADAGRIQPIDGQVDPDLWERYLPASIAATQYKGQHYAIPESLRMMGLFYNRSLVDQPAATLDELMEQAVSGQKVGMSPAFTDMFWGIRAFGGELLDADGQVVLDRGGFANWLAWLVNAEDGPNILIDRDRQTLRTLFGDGELAYLIDGSWMAQDLQNALGEERLGVASLPAGPIGPAGPLLETNGFMLSVASSSRQSDLAIRLAEFVTNPEQATTLMRRGHRIPASHRIRISPNIDPIAFPFISQARTAVPFRNSSIMDAVIEIGAGTYHRVLQGVEGPVDVANSTTQAINLALGVAPESLATSSCQQLGVLEIGHAFAENDARTLDQIVGRFRKACPFVVVRVSAYEPERLRNILQSGSAQSPDLAIIPSDWVSSLVETQSIRNLTSLVPSEMLQAFRPSAVQTWELGDHLYGIPLTLEVPVLYYNRTTVGEPARTLADLIAEGIAGRATALNISFDQAYWGLTAFGGRLFDADSRVILDQGGFTEWLTWLQNARREAGLIVDTDEDRLLSSFLEGEASYFVGGPQALAQAEDALGRENLGVARLPTGPVADAVPLLTSTGLAISSSAGEETSNLAFLFIRHATDVDNQQLLMSAARRAPIHISVDYRTEPIISTFLEQSSNAVVYPNIPEMATVEAFGSQAYDAISGDSAPSQETVERRIAEIVEQINDANGLPRSSSEPDTEAEAQ